MPIDAKKRFKFFDVPVDAVTMEEAVEMAKGMLSGDKLNKIFTPNPEILLEASRNEQYRAVLQTADLSLPDGIGLVLMGRLLGISFRERVSGVDFMLRLCELATRQGKKVFLLGGRNGVAEKTAIVLKKQFPDIQIAGWSEDIDLPKIGFDADIIFVALGVQKQERWIYDFPLKPSNVKIAMAVGGAFDMMSGDIPRAPNFFKNTGLEWLWRLAQEPKKRCKRAFRAVVVFPIKILIYQLWRRNI